jgi:hypothetical protein
MKFKEIDNNIIKSKFNEIELFEKYKKIISSYHNQLNKKLDLQECQCCHQLIPNHQIKIIYKAIENEIFMELFEKITLPIKICKIYCLRDINNNSIPKFSSLNNMELKESPLVLKCLNHFELNLVQLGKCFHTVTKLKPFKKFNNLYSGIPALKGNYLLFNFHLQIF